MFLIRGRTTSAPNPLNSKKSWKDHPAMTRRDYSQHRATRGRAVCIPPHTTWRGEPSERMLHGMSRSTRVAGCNPRRAGRHQPWGERSARQSVASYVALSTRAGRGDSAGRFVNVPASNDCAAGNRDSTTVARQVSGSKGPGTSLVRMLLVLGGLNLVLAARRRPVDEPPKLQYGRVAVQESA